VTLPANPKALVKEVRRLSEQMADPSISHLDRAVLATRIAEAADYLARFEVTAARDADGCTWQQVGDAFGVIRQTAQERFGQGPEGMRSRSTRYGEGWRQSKSAKASGSTSSSSSRRRSG
jgi:hypothetical protein